MNHPDPKIDIAILRVGGIDENTPVIALPAFLDEAIGSFDFVLAKPIIFGYPPIAWSVRPDLIIATAEINAVIDTRLDRYVRFILSTSPRGGFSGGPAILSEEWTLGVITESAV